MWVWGERGRALGPFGRRTFHLSPSGPPHSFGARLDEFASKSGARIGRVTRRPGSRGGKEGWDVASRPAPPLGNGVAWGKANASWWLDR